MEISRYLNEYKKHDPRDFYNWISQGRTMEVRFLSNYLGQKFSNWDLIKVVAAAVKAEHRYNSIYINSYDQLKDILLYKIQKWPLTRIYNIFIGVNPRRKVYVKSRGGLLYKSYYGGIAGTSHIQNILCDIESKKKFEGSAPEALLEECIQGAKFLAKQLELENYYINISGNGTHLWFPLERPIELEVPSFTEFDDKVKYNLKEDPIYTHIKTYNRFIEKLNKMLQKYNPNLMVDEGAKDISRIARPTGSWNVKVGKTARAVGTAVIFNNNINIINNKFMAAAPLNNKKSLGDLRKVSRSSRHRYNPLNLRESPVYKLMVSQYLPSILSRNHYLEQSFARLLRDNEIQLSEVQTIIQEMDVAQRKNVQVDPDYLDDDQVFNSEMINSYCIGCKVDLVYPLLEDVPEVKGELITDERYILLNGYSQQTIDKMCIEHNKETPDSYLELKGLIRKFVDAGHNRTAIFFTIKNMLKEDWDYYARNKIVVQILNKTRRRYDI